MFNLFPTSSPVTQNTVHLTIDEDTQVELTSCKEALDFVQGYFEEVNDICEGTELVPFEFYSKHCVIGVTFNNTDDILEVTCLDHLKELAEHC